MENHKLDEQILEQYSLWMMDNKYSIKTIRDYIRYIKKIIGGDNIINNQRINIFLSKNNNLVKRASVKLFLSYLEDNHNIKIKDIKFARIRKKTNALKSITKHELDKIYDFLNDDYKLYFKIMYHGGMRVSEVAAIMTNDFNWQNWSQNPKEYGELTVYKTKRNKERIIPIFPELMVEIYNYIPKHDDGALKIIKLFDFAYNRYVRRKRKKGYTPELIEYHYIKKVKRTFQNHLKKAAKEAINRDIKSHMIRASRATHLDESGAKATTIQFLLGHDNLATTSRYIDNNPQKLKREIKKIDDLEEYED